MNRHRNNRRMGRAAQQGAGSLIVVLVLFFVISLVAAYSSRNMVFEQKISANQYRFTQAFEAAQAGAEWTLATINAGVIDASCLPTNGPGTNFRSRYFTIDPNSGNIAYKTYLTGAVTTRLAAECVRAPGGWNCSCPSNGPPVLAAPAASSAPAPAFKVTFNSGGRAGVFSLQSQSCTVLDPSCLSSTIVGGTAGAVAVVKMLVGLKGAISAPPVAPLTSRGSVTMNAGAVTNAEPLVGGLTIDAAGAVNAPGTALTSVPGTPGGASIVATDAGLASYLGASGADLWFGSVMGLTKAMYQQQPAAITPICPASCDAVSLATLAANNPGRIIWLTGDVTLASAATIGSAAAPALLVVNGNLSVTAAGVVINGLVYGFPQAGVANWTLSGSPTINGAVVSEADFVATDAPNLVYDLTILKTLRTSSGSFVRVPGSWIDQ